MKLFNIQFYKNNTRIYIYAYIYVMDKRVYLKKDGSQVPRIFLNNVLKIFFKKIYTREEGYKKYTHVVRSVKY